MLDAPVQIQDDALTYDSELRHRLMGLFKTHFNNSYGEFKLNICDQPLNLHFSDEAMAQCYMPALNHLRQNESNLSTPFTLMVIDIGKIKGGAFNSLAEFIDVFFKTSVHSEKNREHASHFLAFEDFAYYYNHQSNWGVWLTYNHKAFSQWHFANPFRYFLYDWLLKKNIQLLHTSAISNGTSTLLLSGPSGAGKSTTALLAMKAGYGLLGDDHCAVSVSPKPYAYSLYNAVKIDERLMANHFKDEASFSKAHIRTQKINKAIINVHDINPNKMHSGLPVRALVYLTIDKNTSTPDVEVISKSKALQVLSLSTIEQCAWVSRPKVFQNMKQIVDALPCYHLTLSSAFSQNIYALGDIFHG